MVLQQIQWLNSGWIPWSHPSFEPYRSCQLPEPGGDFLSDAGFLNLENFQPLARFKVRKLLATPQKAEWLGRALQASATMFKPTEEHVDVTH